ncbi:MAG TPA: PQQ-binding-like beta-propeller repeat protein [Candidatus Sulfotelmatobacter sp.]|nr:PQQ-binding-like beta-propeller repeat protein [Candidatus Sulfotelmatobacter sp.]
MQNSRSKTLVAITIIIMLASITTITLPAQSQTTYTNQQEGGSIPGPLASGITPGKLEPTRSFLSFNPNPIGKGQTLLVNMWLNPALHVSRYFKDYTVIITKPDGTTETVKKDSYRADATAWFEYVPDQVGEWKLKFDFPGGYFPAGNYTIYPGAFVGANIVNFQSSVYYQPSQTQEQKLTVQENYVYSWPPAALPTDYWTRPASILNREWWPILGNYPGTGYEGGGPMWDALYPNTNPAWSARYNFHPWIQAPNTAHMVWKRASAIGGLIGGPAGQLGTTGNPGTPSVIYSGRCYQTITKPNVGSVAQCYDLRTGEIYYEIPTSSGGVTPSYVSYPRGTGSEVPGAEATQTYSVELLSISSTQLQKINPWTGAVTNISITVSPSLSGTTYYKDSQCLSIQNLGTTSAPNYRLINWTTIGSSTNFTSRIGSNMSYARSSLPTLIDFNAGYGANQNSITEGNTTGIYEGMRLEGINLWTGQSIWNVTIDEPRYSDSCHVADHGKVAVLSQGGHFLAYDLATGKQLWTSEQMDYPWDAASFGAYAIASAYGMFYRFGYGGVYAFDWNDGHIVWKYTSPALAAFESPYLAEEGGESVYPFNTGGVIADGKLYTRNTEHTASWPRTRGWSIHCINITTGEGIWRLSGETTPGAMADGYLTAANSWDGYMYVFGKGKSTTTVTAPDVSVPKGTAVVIKGSVLDLSPAQPNTPCVSKDSMTLQMEYLHMQQPMDGIWHNETVMGVPVTLTAFDSNGNPVDIGTVSTDGYYGTFSKTWTPPNEGDYKIIASFAGDDSYGSSAASTSISVGPAPTTTNTDNQQQISVPDYTMTIVYGVIAIIVAIAVGIAIAILVLRKK